MIFTRAGKPKYERQKKDYFSTARLRNVAYARQTVDATFRSRSHRAVIRVCDESGGVIETHEQAGELKER